MAGKTHNLILVNHAGGQSRQDFAEIAAKIARIAPEVDVHVAAHDVTSAESGLPEEIWSRPSLTVSFRWPEKFRPKRGLVYAGRPIYKLKQLQIFQKAGLDVPLTIAYEFGRPLARGFWGEHVVMKPTTLETASRGRFTYLLRTEAVGPIAPKLFPPQHPARKGPVLVQRFIDTGEYATSYRVLTLFGEPIMCVLSRAKEKRPPLDAPDDVLLRSQVAANAQDRATNELVAPPDILAYGRKVARAMPGIPLQGIDIIREEGTGRLFVLENNSGGNTWHYSSALAEESRKHITREERMEQFGAWDVAAKVLAERTLRDAR